VTADEQCSARPGPWEENPPLWQDSYAAAADAEDAADRHGQVLLGLRSLKARGHRLTGEDGELDGELIVAALDVEGVGDSDTPPAIRLRALGATVVRNMAIEMYDRRAAERRRQPPPRAPAPPRAARRLERPRAPRATTRRRSAATSARAGPTETSGGEGGDDDPPRPDGCSRSDPATSQPPRCSKRPHPEDQRSSSILLVPVVAPQSEIDQARETIQRILFGDKEVVKHGS